MTPQRLLKAGTPRTFGAVAEDAVAQKGPAVIFADERERYTGDEAASAIGRVRHAVANLGAPPGARAAFFAGASARHALTFIACQQQGVVPCALHLREPVPRLREALEWLEPSLVLCDEENEELAAKALAAASITAPLVTLAETPVTAAETALGECFSGQGAGASPIGPVPGEDDLALILLSSGTTGAAKGTLNLQRTLVATAGAGEPIFGEITRESAVIVPVAPSAAAWIHIVLPFFAAGATVHFMSRFDAARYVETLARERITHAPGVPTMWRLLLPEFARCSQAFDTLRVAFFAGEVGSAELVSSIKRQLPNAQLRTGYLSAEAGCASACVADEATLVRGNKPTTAGKPIEGCELKIVAAEGAIEDALPNNIDGEIILRSESVASGYWKAPELTQHRFVDGWWRSGDMGHVDDEGDLFIIGRTDHIINSGGIKIAAEEVEAALMQHPAVTLAAVVPEPDARWGQAVVAHVVLSNPAVTPETILGFCRERELIASVKLPKKIIVHDRLPVGPTGKLNRRALVAQQTQTKPVAG